MTSTSIDILAGHFGSMRALSRAMGVSHTLLSRWNARDGQIPHQHNTVVREAARSLAKDHASDWDANRTKLFFGVVENCLQEPVCKECGRAL